MGVFISFILSLSLLYGPWIIYMLCVPRAVHIFQMEGYKARDYMRWLPKNYKNAFSAGAPQFIACLIFALSMIILDAILLNSAPQYFTSRLIVIQSIMFFVVFAVFSVFIFLCLTTTSVTVFSISTFSLFSSTAT